MPKPGKRGAGNLRLRKDGRWEGRCFIRYDENGKPVYKNVLDRDKKAAQEKLNRLIEECAGMKSSKIKSDMPFGDWLEFWYEYFSKPGLRPKTQECYESRIYDHIIPQLGSIPLNKLTQLDLQQFYHQIKTSGRLKNAEKLGKGLSDRSVRSCHATCRSALEKAKNEKLILHNPAVGCKLPPKKAAEMQVFDHDEMRKFLIEAKKQNYFELCLLELATGMRKGELLALQWHDINFSTSELNICRQVSRVKGTLVTSKPKTKASIRTVILPPSVVNVLEEYKDQQNQVSRWLFPSPVKEDSPLDPDSIGRRMHKIMDAAGVKQVRFHDLRHTFATNAIEGGMDPKTLSAVIGHVSAATTLDIYSHVTDNMQKNAAQKIGGFLDRGKSKMEKSKIIAFKPDNNPDIPILRGNGSVRKRADGRWEGRYAVIGRDGNKMQKSIYGSDENTVRERMDKMNELSDRIKAALQAADGAVTDEIRKDVNLLKELQKPEKQAK
jgi:integrase